MARKRTQEVPAPRPDRDAADFASKLVRWFYPADWDVEHDDPSALGITGWFCLKSDGRWHGPYLTSETAAQKLV